MNHLILSCLILLQLLTGSSALCTQQKRTAAQDTKNGEVENKAAEKTADFVRAGYRDSISRLRSGKYNVLGTVEINDVKQPLKGEVQFFSAFDFDEGIFRFDRTEPSLIQNPDDSSEIKTVEVGGKFISQPDRIIRWALQQNLRANIEQPGPIQDGLVKPFDVRCVGMTSWTSLDRGATWEKCNNVLARPVTDAIQVNEHLYQLAWEVSPEENGRISIPVRFETTFDSQLGFCPVKYASYVGTDGAGGWLEPKNITETKWEQREDVWLPVFLYQEQRTKHPPATSRRELTFNWELVNAPLDE